GVIVQAAGDKLKLRAKTAPPAALLAALREHKPELLTVLSALPVFTPKASALFQWLPLDLEATEEALQERIGILIADGMPEAEAVREARWQEDRAGCWQGFRLHAKLILDRPLDEREPLLAEYQCAAALAFGGVVAQHMAKSMA